MKKTPSGRAWTTSPEFGPGSNLIWFKGLGFKSENKNELIHFQSGITGQPLSSGEADDLGTVVLGRHFQLDALGD
jgi:hypothetical protein